MAFKERVFSGVQPTGNLHLGNYLGAHRASSSRCRTSYDCIYCVVDLHAITVWQDPAELPKATREVTAAFLACGIDPKKHIVFNQSQVAEHAELAWVFNCVARLGWLNRMTQFKEKAGKDRENASVGLYAYPALMAADILVYRATHVPVGEDQKQHLELSRDIAQKFNNDFAESIAAHGYGDAFFPLPEPLIQGPATRVMSLRDGTKKMSKSDASDQSRINLTDDADTIAHKIRTRQDRSRAAAERGEGPGGAARGRQSGRHLCRARRRPARRTCSRSSAARNSRPSRPRWPIWRSPSSAPITAEMQRLMADPAYIDSVLADGAARAQVHRRRDHEGGQGHRRLRAPLSAVIRPTVQPSRLQRAACAAAERRGSILQLAGADEQEAPQLRGRSLAEIPGRHRRHAGVRPRASISPAGARCASAPPCSCCA